MAGITSNSWQVAAASVVLPLNALAGSPAFLSSVAFLGASALMVGVATTCWYGFSVTSDFWGNVAALPWFTSPQGLSLPPPSLSHAPSCAEVQIKRAAAGAHSRTRAPMPPLCHVPRQGSRVCAPFSFWRRRKNGCRELQTMQECKEGAADPLCKLALALQALTHTHVYAHPTYV